MTLRNQVLVIDDDDELRETIVEVLVDTGFVVGQADNGAVALGLLRGAEALPSVILLDLMMPEMNGWEFREAQLGDPRLAAIPVVIMTAHPATGPLPAPAREILRKPFASATLLAAIARCATA